MGDLLELVLPSRCAGCGVDGRGALCEACRPAGLVIVPGSFEPLNTVWAASSYPGPLGVALLRGKGSPRRDLIARLGAALCVAQIAPLRQRRYAAVVPAPSPWTRRLQRGFSPAALLAHAVASELGVPVEYALSMRPGPRQASLSARARQRNLSRRIRPRRPVDGPVLLVDDVVTTGATARMCAVELLGAGAQRVDLLVLCATPPPGAHLKNVQDL